MPVSVRVGVYIPSQGTERAENVTERWGCVSDSGETNGAPGECDRQEILLNQDTSPKGAAVITISSY